MVADAGHDVAEVVQVLVGQGSSSRRVMRTAQVFARSDAAQLGELVARVDAGDMTIDVAQRRPLTDLPAVHDHAAAGQLPGKTILTP